MNEQTLEAQLTEATASAAVTELIKHLTNANNRLPTFALPDTIVAINQLGQICRTHTNADDANIEAAMSLVSAALLNALTDHKITFINDDGVLAEA